MDGLPPISEVMAKMRQLHPEDRTRYLQSVMGARTLNPVLLDARARLVTALNEAHLWPAGCPGSNQPVRQA